MGQCLAAISGEQQQAPPQQNAGYPGGGGRPQQQQPAVPPRNNQPAPARGGGNAPAQPGSAPVFNGARSWPASSSAGDPARFEAGVHAKKRGDLLAQSQAAWQSGDKALAKRLSDQGKAEGAAMERCNAQAAEAYFADNNRDKGIGEIDLHGLHVEEALERVEARLRECEAQRVQQLVVIVGRGNHSKDGVKIRPAMERMIQQHRLRVAVDSPNVGCITILFGQAESGFVHAPGSRNAHLTKPADGGCAQM